LHFAGIWTWQELDRQAQREFGGHTRYPDPSNQWVVSKERSVEEAVVLCADPHNSWGQDTDWYETHLHGGGLNAFGFTVPGLPVLLFGHNDFLGWSSLPGGSDGIDIYRIDFRSSDSLNYKYGDT